jgi:hypothetical protein
MLANTIDVPPYIGEASAPFDVRIAPGDPDRSFLIAKITLPGAGQGLKMPPTDMQLTDEAVDVIREWIEQMDAP